MQFQVPQFIEVEDKIFGSLTFKQFIYLCGGFGVCYLLWRLLPIYLSLPIIFALGGFAVALAFLEINGRPFILAVESAFFYLIHSKLYLWNNARNRSIKSTMKKDATVAARHDVYVPHLSESKLHELAWSLDIRERVAAGTATDAERAHDTTDVLSPVHTLKQVLPSHH